MKTDTNSNAYTIAYSSAVVVVVAFLLAFASKALEPASAANERIDKKKQILASLNIRGIGNGEVEERYRECVTCDKIIRADGSTADEGGAGDGAGFKVSMKDITDSCLPVYCCRVGGKTKYVIPLNGKGLWGGIWGYIALDEDKNTVFGAYFSHASETAGLGARITERAFQDQFIGKKVFGESGGAVLLSVVKKREPDKADFQCDGISGATLTSEGVSDMIKDCLAKYRAFLLDTSESRPQKAPRGAAGETAVRNQGHKTR